MTEPITVTRRTESGKSFHRKWTDLPLVIRHVAWAVYIAVGSTALLIAWMLIVPDVVVDWIAAWQDTDSEGRIRLVTAAIGILVVTWIGGVSLIHILRTEPRGRHTNDQDTASLGDR